MSFEQEIAKRNQHIVHLIAIENAKRATKDINDGQKIILEQIKKRKFNYPITLDQSFAVKGVIKNNKLEVKC